MKYGLGIDTGGTHTDLILIDYQSTHIWTAKVRTTPDQPLVGIRNGLDRVLRASGADIAHLDELIYGTTLVTNMLVQHEEVKTALITTRGFRDVLEIGRAYRTENIYDIQMERVPPLVRRNLRLEVAERVDFQGKVLEPLDVATCRELVRDLKARGVESIAVCLLHSYVNPAHEEEVKAIIAQEYPEAYVSLSSEINPVFREYERTSTTVVNAYVTPRMVKHLDDFETQMTQRGVQGRLYTMQANGGKATFHAAREFPVNVTNSGPIAGAIAGAHVARLAGYPNAITLDMGGTSCDVSLIERGEPKFTAESRVEGYPVQITTIDLNIVGAGGGSIAWLDAAGGLRVGPKSAGADPGPVCYQLGGTQPTVTDANLVTGRLNPDYFLGGEKQLDVEAALRAINDQIAQPLRMAPLEAAWGILQVANAIMIRAIKLVSVERGYDPHDFALIAFGGAGPMHATRLARELEIPIVVIPRYPGNLSALGLTLADIRHDYVITRISGLDDLDPVSCEATFQQLEARARKRLNREEVAADFQHVLRSCGMRYYGQAHELNVPVEGSLRTRDAIDRLGQAYHAAHRRTYGHAMEGDPIEIVNYQVSAIGTSPKPDLTNVWKSDGNAMKGRRDVFFETGRRPCSIYERRLLTSGCQINGPAVVEQAGSTALLHPHHNAHVDTYGNLIVAVTDSEVGGS